MAAYLPHPDYLGFICILLVLFHLFVLFQRINSSYSAKILKDTCRLKTSGRIEFVDRGICYAGTKFHKRGRFHASYTPIYIFHWYTVYSYDAKGQHYTGVDSRLPLAFLPAGKPGEEAEIYYNPNDGRIFYCPGEDKNARYGYLMFIGLSVLAGLAVYLFLVLADYLH